MGLIRNKMIDVRTYPKPLSVQTLGSGQFQYRAVVDGEGKVIFRITHSGVIQGVQRQSDYYLNYEREFNRVNVMFDLLRSEVHRIEVNPFEYEDSMKDYIQRNRLF